MCVNDEVVVKRGIEEDHQWRNVWFFCMYDIPLIVCYAESLAAETLSCVRFIKVYINQPANATIMLAG